jgi:hypothetical protein
MSKLESALPPSEPSQECETASSPGTPDLEMRRRAAAVLEVLGGAKSPSEAAESLEISLPRYYQLEARALEGLITACEPRARGRGRSAGEGKTFHALRKENDRLRQDLTRTQALTRAVQRAAGMPGGDDDKIPAEGRGRRKRRASARALRAARQLSPASKGPSLPTSPLDVEPQP